MGFKKKEESLCTDCHYANTAASFYSMMAHRSGGALISDIKNKELLHVLLIDGKYVSPESNYSVKEIQDALLRGKEYLSHVHISFHEEPCEDEEHMDHIRPISARQFYCATFVISLVFEGKYNHAMHELMDCINDYGNATIHETTISINEYALYMCLIDTFLQKLQLEGK